LSAEATVTLTIEAANIAPVGSDDAFTLTQDSPLTVAAPGLLANDTDADGDALTAQLGTDVAHGTLTLNADGSFSYTPEAGYTGTDSFTYQVSDGTDLSEAVTVSLTIEAAVPQNSATFDAATGTLTITNTSGDTGIVVTVHDGNVVVLFDGVADTSLGDLQAKSVTHLVVNAGSGNNVVDLSDVKAAHFKNLESVTANLGDGNDRIVGSSLGDFIDAGAGDDSIKGMKGDDTLVGGLGDDTLIGGKGNDSIDGGAGNDRLIASKGQDTVLGGVGDDFLSGERRDQLDGGEGNNTIQRQEGQEDSSDCHHDHHDSHQMGPGNSHSDSHSNRLDLVDEAFTDRFGGLRLH
jgi:VCBS repeat-containing protein